MTDKNLGLAIMERDIYMKRALYDHLLTPTYSRLSNAEAREAMEVVNGELKDALAAHVQFS